jgi:hypothetical protein
MGPRWRKLGRIFAADGSRPWLHSHAANPVALPLDDRHIRVYFSSHDAQKRSSIAWFEIDLERPAAILRTAEQPVLEPGAPGLFDDSGTSLGCVVPDGGELLLYYVGWNLGVTVPWRNSIGLAVGDADGLTFRKHGRAPVLDRSDADPFSLSYPWVLREGGRFRMWYGSNLTWGPTIDSMTHAIRCAESADGRHWRPGPQVLGPAGGSETALARPCVLREPERYRMWYSRRGQSYRIGYAESRDGLSWVRRDELAGIDVSASGWDADMVCYPHVFTARGQHFLLYNGNGYGASGIGLAVLEHGR